VVVPGAVGDVATEAKIAYLLGPDLTAAVRRLYPNSSLSSWVSRNFGSIEGLGKALTRHKAAGSPVSLSLHSMDAKAANAMVVGLEMRR